MMTSSKLRNLTSNPSISGSTSCAGRVLLNFITPYLHEKLEYSENLKSFRKLRCCIFRKYQKYKMSKKSPTDFSLRLVTNKEECTILRIYDVNFVKKWHMS